MSYWLNSRKVLARRPPSHVSTPRSNKAPHRLGRDPREELGGVSVGTIIDYLVQSRDTLQAAIDDPAFCRTIEDVAEATATALRNGGKLLLAGNGGSAADAQ